MIIELLIFVALVGIGLGVWSLRGEINEHERMRADMKHMKEELERLKGK
jgi:hypothetical protein